MTLNDKKKSCKKKQTNKMTMVQDKPMFFEEGDSLSPVPDKVLAKYAQDLLEWALKEDAIKVTEYITLRTRVTRQVFYDWARRYKPLHDAIEQAKIIIGDRRERKALKGEYNSNIVLNTMPLYDQEYKDLYEWKAKLKTAHASDTPKIVILDNLVPGHSVKIVSTNEDRDPDTSE